MAPWSEGFVTANHIQVHYYRTGGGKPQVVLNHGAADDGLCWTHLAKELEKEYDLILPDARGHGKSDSGNGDYSTQPRVSDLAGLIRELQLDRPVVGGHSMGADTAMHLAAEFPDLARGVILEDPPILLPGEKLGSREPAMKAGDIGKMMATFMRIYKEVPRWVGLRMARKTYPAYPEDELKPWVDSKKRLSHDFLNALPSLKLGVEDPFAVFQKIRLPVLLFIGDREKMAFVSRETAQKAVQANPGVRVVELAGASHDIRRTRFDGYLPALEEFLGGIYHG
jgi:N-formylmaleamate deformylase